MKVCSICLTNLPLVKFDQQTTGKLGRRADCKECRKRFVQSERGLIKSIYGNQLLRSRRRGYKAPTYTEDQLVTWITQQPNFKSLYSAWVTSNYESELKPSVDRLNDYKSYCLTNIRLVTWKENNDKHHSDKLQGINNKNSLAVDMLDMQGIFIKRFYSVSEAARQFNGIPSNIIGAINKRTYIRDGKEKITLSAYNHLWRYSTIPNDNQEII